MSGGGDGRSNDGADDVELAIATYRFEDRSPRPKPWPWAVLADDEEFARELESHLGFAASFWLVRIADGQPLRSAGWWRLVAEEHEPRRWWVCDLPGPRSFEAASSIAEGIVASYDLAHRSTRG